MTASLQGVLVMLAGGQGAKTGAKGGKLLAVERNGPISLADHVSIVAMMMNCNSIMFALLTNCLRWMSCSGLVRQKKLTAK
jgi:hypothetical protein